MVSLRHFLLLEVKKLNYKRAKIFVLLFVFCIVAYFTNDFQLINIEKTAIIVALGIDKSEDGLEVTTQIAVPQASNQNTSNSDAILSAKDKTLYGALEKISLETGWYPKLTFCNLILLGKDLTNENFTPIIDYILTSNRFQSSAVIATTEQSAKETLKSATPLDYISSFALQKILLRNLDRSSSVLVSDVRKFTSLSRSRSQFCYAPLIKTVKTDDKPQGDSSTSASLFNQFAMVNENHNSKINALVSGDGSSSNGQNSDSSSQSNGENQNKSVVFEASSTLVFSNGKLACTFSKEQTHCYNLITKTVRETFIPVTIKKGDKQIDALISVVSNKPKINLQIIDNLPHLKIELTLVCEKEETYQNQTVSELVVANKVSKEGLFEVEKRVESEVKQLVNLSILSNCDFLQTKEMLYRFCPNDYYKFKDDILSLLKFDVTVHCKNYR